MPTPPSSPARDAPSPTVADALALLASDVGATASQPGPDVHAPLTGAAPDQAAGPGAIGWVSPAALARDPGRAGRFRGALLVVPAGTTPLPDCAVVASGSPRLTFSRLVSSLLPSRVQTPWPHAPASVAASAAVDPSARLAAGVVVGEGVVIGARVEVGPNAVLAHCSLHDGVRVGPSCTIGADGFGYTRDADGVLVPFPHLGRVVIEAGATVGANTCVDRGALGETRIGARTRIDNLVHVAHNVQIGADCAVIARAMIAGGVTVGDRAWIAPSASILNQVTVGADAVVGMGAVVIRDVAPGSTVVGNPARPL